ncbi:MAG TPA: hypothetical protein VFI06_15665 [Chitinophagaceae bacterium]|nr:hypothetical protein [Chitinophagaceae bacterium]
MARIKRSVLGFWVMVIIFASRWVFLYITYRNIRKLEGFSLDRLPLRFLVVELAVLVILLAEIITYWALRYKIRNKWWVRLHVWPLFSFMVVFPLLLMILSVLIVRHYGSLGIGLLKVRAFLFWTIVPLSHIFFIVTIVQSFKPIKQPISDEPPGLLDEFIN